MLKPRAELDPHRLFSTFDLAPRRALVVAVSGGSDSLALLLLTKSFLDRAAPGTRLVAVTVDHALRAGSAAEAEEVARFAARHQISHRTMVWTGKKPETGIPAAARDARYRLLAEAAALEGTDVILTGHTADDQAETVLMRRARQDARPDARGLAGMAPVTLFDGTAWVVRPLLGVRRETLRDYLRARGVSWLEDPTNVNEAFERPRLRAALGREEADRVSETLAMAEVAAQQRLRLGAEAARLIRAHATRPAAGLLRLDPAFAAAPDVEAAIYALRILLSVTGGTAFLPDETRAAAIFRRLAEESFCATLSRTVVDARRAGFFLRREARHLPGPQAPHDGMIWDGRYRLSTSVVTGCLAVAPLGASQAKMTENQAAEAPASLVRAARAAQPALLSSGECLGPLAADTPLHGIAARPVMAPWARFLPCFDLEPARAVAALVGAPMPPTPPLAAILLAGPNPNA
ncbi:tRNA lysidine(34) synthetase TilS [Mesorhizobium sp. KR1-2]|uniref:tRNA lysidine(34) synthetase TilS n=1 Tax=Mesorhizobium sp. KR1-2 TaxID=3156609 RepID=UPI0032B4E49F